MKLATYKESIQNYQAMGPTESDVASQPGFAPEAIVTYFCGSIELFVACREIFLEQASLRLLGIREAHAADDDAQVRHHAHTLKGSAATLGARALAAACEQLENGDAVTSIERERCIRDAAAGLDVFIAASATHGVRAASLHPPFEGKREP